MHTFFSTRPTRAYENLPMVIPVVESREASSISGYFLRHPYRCYMAVLAVAIAVVAMPALAQSQMPQAHQQGDIVYISGGIGADETPWVNARRELWEEAGVPPQIFDQIEPVGRIHMRRPIPGRGFHDEQLYIYDLELAENFIPTNPLTLGIDQLHRHWFTNNIGSPHNYRIFTFQIDTSRL